MKLSVIIVNYNVRYYVDQCLRSVLRAFAVMQSAERSGEADCKVVASNMNAGCMKAEVIVVDNHSSDSSVEYLQQRYPKEHYPMVHIVSSLHNLGFARGNNIAIRQSKGEYVLLLNPDTIVGEDVFLQCVRFMDSHADAGAVGVRMQNCAGKIAMESRRGLPSPMVAFYKMIGLTARFPKSRTFGHYYMGYLPWDKPAQIEVVSGAFCMLRREALDQVGLLDEDFFMYGEDIDLSYRVLKGGYHNYYLPLDILHYKGESTEKSSFRYVHVFYEAMLIFFRKHYSGMTFLLSFPIKFAIYAKASVALVRMLSDRMRKSLGFYDKLTSVRTIYVLEGSEEMKRACREIATRLGLDVREEWKGDGCCYRVFDADSISYGDMLDKMKCQNNTQVKMATYTREMGAIITDKEVLR